MKGMILTLLGIATIIVAVRNPFNIGTPASPIAGIWTPARREMTNPQAGASTQPSQKGS